MSNTIKFNQTVGKVAGAIYSDIAEKFPFPPLMLVPAVTFKVRKVLEQITDPELLNEEQKEELAKEIQISIVPMLFSYDVDAEIIEQLTPAIKAAAFRALI